MLLIFPAMGYSAESTPLSATSDLEKNLGKGSADEYSIAMVAGESVLIIVKQEGVDVVIDVVAPNGTLLDSVDSPTGRNGNEVVEIFATQSGLYRLRTYPISLDEPVGKYRLTVTEKRTREQSSVILASRQKVRDEATNWLAARSAELPSLDLLVEETKLPPLDSLAERARVVGLGEATHGSREFGDVRFALTKRLIQQHGFRIVALEVSAPGMRALEPYVRGVSEKTPDVARVIESGWIGRRTRRELIEWLRNWNRSHPSDRVTLIGVDPQENSKSREIVAAFIQRAYSPQVVAQWNDTAKELDAADEQTAVFGDSGVNDKAAQFTAGLLAKMTLDAPILRARFGDETYTQAWQAAKDLAEFSDFNSGGNDPLAHSRDWYMAAEVLRNIEDATIPKKAVFWAHNAHIASTTARYEPAGTVLRNTLGCKYVAVAITFGEGVFVAQIPNDLEDRLATSSLPMYEGDTIESLLAKARRGPTLATWSCSPQVPTVPTWLSKPQLMHWVGGLYKPGSLVSSAFRPFNLLHDFDAIIYLPHVSADESPTDRPLIPPRKR